MSPEEKKKKKKKTTSKKATKKKRTKLATSKKAKVAKKKTTKKAATKVRKAAPRAKAKAAPVSEAKPEAPAAPSVPPGAAAPSGPYVDHGGDLPAGFGDDRVHVLVRDPQWIFVYWELYGGHSNHLVQTYGAGREFTELPWHLRIHSSDGALQQEVAVYVGASNWYVHIGEGKHIRVELGFYTHEGDFVVAASTDTVAMPTGTPSADRTETWMQRTPEQQVVPGEKGYVLIPGTAPEGGAIDIADAARQPTPRYGARAPGAAPSSTFLQPPSGKRK